MSEVPVDPPCCHEDLGGGFCLKSIYPPRVMEEDMLWFLTNYQLLPYHCPKRFNSRFTKCNSPCGSFHSYQVRRFAQDGQMEKAEASEVDLPCHSISPKMKEPWMKRINLHGSTKILRTYFRDLGPAWFEGGNQMSWWKLDGTPQNTLTFHRRKPPEWVDTHHKDSQTSKKVSPYHDFQTL